jgi:GTP-binding protein
MEKNCCKAMYMKNMRSSSSEGTVQLTPPTVFSLEQCLDFLEHDELLKVTSKSPNLHKKELDPNKRKRQNQR